MNLKDDFPLYLKDDENNIYIYMYDDDKCSQCDVVGRDVYYRQTWKSFALRISPSVVFTSEYTKLCDSCFNKKTHEYVWG